MLLDLQPDCTVVGQAGTVLEAERQLEGVDVALVDLNLPDGSGVDVIRKLTLEHPESVSILLTASHSQSDFALAVEAGAEATINKSARTTEIVDTIRRVAAGERVLSADEMVAVLRLATEERDADRRAEQFRDLLTPRERQILHALAGGLSNKQIAEQLSVTPRTVSTHMSSILQKLEVDSRLQAFILAIRYQLIEAPTTRRSIPKAPRS